MGVFSVGDLSPKVTYLWEKFPILSVQFFTVVLAFESENKKK